MSEKISEFTQYFLNKFGDNQDQCQKYFSRFKKNSSWMPKKIKEIGNMDWEELERNGFLYILLDDLSKCDDKPEDMAKIQTFINCLCKMSSKCGNPSYKFLSWIKQKDNLTPEQKILLIKKLLMKKFNLKTLNEALDDARYPEKPVILEGVLMEGGNKNRKKGRKTRKSKKVRKQRKNKTRR